MSKQDTAVEHYSNELIKLFDEEEHLNLPINLLKKMIALKIEAKELEKNQMIDFAYSQIKETRSGFRELIFNKVPEEIFNETFNQ